MFSFLKKKNPQQQSNERLGRTVQHAKFIWNGADVELRSLLIRNTVTINDDRTFLAYVNAPFERLPYDVQIRLGPVVEIYEQTPYVLDR